MAFVFLKTETGAETAVLKTLKQIEGVEEAYRLNGICDIVAKVTAASTDNLQEIVNHRIRQIGKVRTTLTMIGINNCGQSDKRLH